MLAFKRLGLDSVWSRLMGTLALVVVPAAILILLLAYSLYTTAYSDVQATQRTAAVGRAAAVRAWLDAAGRSLANQAFAAGYLGAERCDMLADTFLRRNSGFSAVRFFDDKAAACAAGAAIDESLLPSAGASPGLEAYRVAIVGSTLWILASGAHKTPVKGPCILVVDERTLRDRLLAAGEMGETNIALLGAGGDVVVADSRSPGDAWIPALLSPPAATAAWRATDKAGAEAAFAIAPLQGSSLRVLMRFDDERLEAARHRFVILCLTQLAMLGVLAFAYMIAIRRDVVRWIHGIDVAARARGDDPESLALAPVTPQMPRELRRVAQSFNAMADHALEHQHALQNSVEENRALMLEMHHRIKNSLQVIQSYLALIRRSAERPEALLLARIEARVGVLAVAYRLALTPGGMRPIAVKPFLEEICAAAVAGLRRPRQRAAYAISWQGELIVDRAIPLGLGLVEALIAAFSAAEAAYVGVRLTVDDDGEVELRVESDAAPTGPGLPEKIMRGLANQLGADDDAARAGEILAWRFRP